MQRKHPMDVAASSMAKQLIATLGEAQVLQVARECRWLRRLRSITPLALVVACLSTLDVPSLHRVHRDPRARLCTSSPPRSTT